MTSFGHVSCFRCDDGYIGLIDNNGDIYSCIISYSDSKCDISNQVTNLKLKKLSSCFKCKRLETIPLILLKFNLNFNYIQHSQYTMRDTNWLKFKEDK